MINSFPGEKPYQCNICLKCFGYRSAMLRHQNNIHKTQISSKKRDASNKHISWNTTPSVPSMTNSSVISSNTLSLQQSNNSSNIPSQAQDEQIDDNSCPSAEYSITDLSQNHPNNQVTPTVIKVELEDDVSMSRTDNITATTNKPILFQHISK